MLTKIRKYLKYITDNKLVDFYRNLKIGTKLSVVVSTLIIVFLLAFGIIALNITTNSIIKSIDNTLTNKANDTASIIEHEITQTLNRLDKVALGLREIPKDNIKMQMEYLKEELKGYSDFSMFGLSDRAGNVTFTDGSTINIYDTDYFMKGSYGVSAISSPIINGNKIQYHAASPVKSIYGSLQQILIAVIDGDFIGRYTKNIRIGETGYAYAVDKKGTIISHSVAEKITAQENILEDAKKDPKLADLAYHITKMTKGENGIGTYTYEGVKKYMGYAKIKDSDWSLAVTAPESESLHDVVLLSYIIFGFIFIAFAVGILISLMISKYMIRKPIQKLVNATETIASGDIELKLSVDSNDEVGMMGRALQNLIESIKEQALITQQIANGDLTVQVTPRSENDVMSHSLGSVVETVRSLIAETSELSSAAVEGKLSTRGNPENFRGGFQDVVQGINATLDAVTEPVREATEVLEEVAKGNLSIMVQGNYQGDHAVIKEAINNTIVNLKSYIDEIIAVLNELAQGNLDVSIEQEFLGEFAQIQESVQHTIASFTDIVQQISHAAEQVTSGSRQVSQGSQELSQGATEQASSIEELTASITEIAAQTNMNAANASKANELTVTAKENALHGNEQMHHMLTSMSEINSSSTNIYKIIKVIDDIAFQTNMLSLNAAVEAARAGQHGRGFAVVAEEVRNLASRSARAAKETAEMIENSIQKVDEGSKIAQQTAAEFGRIVNSIEDVASLTEEIAVASNEQATAITQINQGIEQVSRVVQNNSATAEESATASEQLSSQAQMMQEMVSKFRIAGQEEQEVVKNSNQPLNYAKIIENITNKSKKLSIDLSEDNFGKY